MALVSTNATLTEVSPAGPRGDSYEQADPNWEAPGLGLKWEGRAGAWLSEPKTTTDEETNDTLTAYELRVPAVADVAVGDRVKLTHAGQELTMRVAGLRLRGVGIEANPYYVIEARLR